MTDTPLLSVRNLKRQFGKAGPAAVEDVSFDLAPGEILALIGPSGCGKTTTLRMIAGFEPPDHGAISLRGRDITATPAEKRGIGMVFQDYALFPHMDVARNILFGAREKTPQTVARALSMVGLDGYGSRYPDELSGGQQQRIALARSFAAEPSLILLDEPFSNLDAALRHATRREIRALLKNAGIGIIIVTHDQEEALSFADRLALMRDGRIVQHGTGQQIYDRPVDAFVATFLGRTNLVPGTARGELCDTPLGTVRLAAPAEGQVTLSMRPELLELQAAAEAGNGRVTGVEFKGHDMTYWVDCAGREMQVDVMNGPRLGEGAAVDLSLRGEAVVLRDPA
ncbi:ABC transporter ATP-binding protein [Paracoccus caeni]|uniref:ABC transporter ATP-binding protein n=1 Tax=Paracoccus caeni TaxID=657651 RepID=A0A934SEB2_9RHOB|nr:ABC transporter ATP-binding protein [Paracoccus caeni]MBK4216098.1 ABC transporter ATP-binding protein [Paracoccus caeni]